MNCEEQPDPELHSAKPEWLPNACGKAIYRNMSAIDAGIRDWTVVRECGSFNEHCAKDENKNWCEEFTPNATGYQMVYYACDSDGCNSGSSLSVGIALMTVSAFLAIINW